MGTELAELINQPLAIGGRTIAGRLVLAPMTFLGHVAFRSLLDDLGGCALMFSEMCGAARVPQENRHASTNFRWRDEEADRLIVQILGADPDKMVAAARRIEAEGLFGVDINLGCAVKGICRFNQGAALLKNPKAAAHLVHQVRRAIQCPLTVKFRTGWHDDPTMAVQTARRLEDAGADALTFHPRVAPDLRTRPAKWEYIALVKQAVSIPVFGNGDVFDAHDCLKMIRTTGCDGVALGRIAIAQPWVFAQWSGGGEPPVADIHLHSALNLILALQHHFDPVTALRRFKRSATYLAANFTYGNTLFNQLRNACDLDAARTVLLDFFNDAPLQLQRPNLNLMR
jgi:tRNA-dihydrouridine synthase B